MTAQKKPTRLRAKPCTYHRIQVGITPQMQAALDHCAQFYERITDRPVSKTLLLRRAVSALREHVDENQALHDVILEMGKLLEHRG